MKALRILTWASAAVLLAWSVCSSASQPVSTIEYLRPADLNKPPSLMPGSPHGHVRQRLEYGQGYRYGHIVNGPLGDIIIWSPTPNQIHDAQIMGSPQQVRPHTSRITGPQLQYKPEYGKTTKPGYGD